MIRTDVVIATLEARIFALQPTWAVTFDWERLKKCAPVVIMRTSRKWSAL